MASAESENAQPFKFAERHQAVVLHPAASVDDDRGDHDRLEQQTDQCCHRVRSSSSS